METPPDDYEPVGHSLTASWKDELDDPTRPSLSALADAGHSFSIPAAGEPKAILCGFESSRMDKLAGPWLDPAASPFDLEPRTAQEKRLKMMTPDTGSDTVSIRNGSSTGAGSSQEHLSAEVGLTVGYPFLNASVSGRYDRAVIGQDSSVRLSRTTSCTAGRVVLQEAPPLSTDAVILLRGRNGRARFRERYGDYYVCGYELGGHAAACMAASTSSSTRIDTLTLTVTVRALWSSASTSTSEAWTTCTAGSTLSLTAYSSVGDAHQEEKMDVTGGADDMQKAANIRAAAGKSLAAVADLPAAVREKMFELGLRDGQAMSLDAAPGICRSGLIVGVLLAPFERLNQYVSLFLQPSIDALVDEAVAGDPRMAMAARLFLSV